MEEYLLILPQNTRRLEIHRKEYENLRVFQEQSDIIKAFFAGVSQDIF